MNDKKRLLYYFLLDLVSAFVAWQLFNVFRFYVFRSTIEFNNVSTFLYDAKSVLISAFIPFFWAQLYFFTGYYVKPRRKTNLGDLLNTSISTLIGVLIIFFAIVVDDYPENPSLYYEIIFGFYFIHFICCWLFRFLLTGPMIIKQSKGEFNVPVLIIGTGENARKLSNEFNQYKSNFSYKLVGCIRYESEHSILPAEEIVGDLTDLPGLIRQWQVEDLILAIDSQDPEVKHTLLNQLYQYRLPVKAAATQKDIVSGYVSLISLFGIPMVSLTPLPMSAWQQKMKLATDRIVALLCLVLLSPLFLYLAYRVRKDTPGSVLFKQDRLGKNGKPFIIYKFRTMYVNAEEEGPKLSCKDDPRVTPFGKLMRRYRLDELPQFINVLKGDMSLVGPRPEREFFVNQILEKAPHYYLTQSVLPGITSWGMVKFGYANSVDKMVKRLEYDILYLENQSILIDLKILLFTLKPLFKGKGI